MQTLSQQTEILCLIALVSVDELRDEVTQPANDHPGLATALPKPYKNP